MRKYAIRNLLLLAMILTAGSVSYSQTSEVSTGNPQNDRAELVALCEKAKDEVKVSRDMIKSYQRTLDEYDRSLESADNLIKLSTDEIALLKVQRDKTAEALKAEREAFARSKAAETELRKALAKEVKKKTFFKNLAKYTTAAAIVLGAVVVLKQ